MADNRSIVYFDQDAEAWVYRASSVGRSLRCLASARQGYDPLPPPEYLETAAEAGNTYDIIVKERLRSTGHTITGEQGEFTLEVAPGLLIRGHLDAEHIIDPFGADRVLEVKSMSKRVWARWLNQDFAGFPEYQTQISLYMASRNAEAYYAVINRDTEEMETRIIKTPPVSLDSIYQKVQLAEWFAKNHQLPVCDSNSPYPCAYTYLCDKTPLDLEGFEEMVAGDEAKLRHLCEQHKELATTITQLQENKEEVRDEIREALGGRSEVKMLGWSIHNKPPMPKRTLDLARLRTRMTELGEDLEEYFTEHDQNPVLRVTPTKTKRR